MKSDAARAPKVDASTKPNRGDGRVKPNFESGSVYLVPEDKKGSPVRILVKKGGAAPVPAGTYRVFNYAIETEKDGAFWCLSGSGPQGRIVEVKAGAETKLDLDLSVHADLKVNAHRGKVKATLGISGDSGLRVVVIKGEALVPVSLEVQDGASKKLAGAAMPYG